MEKQTLSEFIDYLVEHSDKEQCDKLSKMMDTLTSGFKSKFDEESNGLFNRMVEFWKDSNFTL